MFTTFIHWDSEKQEGAVSTPGADMGGKGEVIAISLMEKTAAVKWPGHTAWSGRGERSY